jgi:hypothetical protein
MLVPTALRLHGGAQRGVQPQRHNQMAERLYDGLAAGSASLPLRRPTKTLKLMKLTIVMSRTTTKQQWKPTTRMPRANRMWRWKTPTVTRTRMPQAPTTSKSALSSALFLQISTVSDSPPAHTQAPSCVR